MLSLCNSQHRYIPPIYNSVEWLAFPKVFPNFIHNHVKYRSYLALYQKVF